MGAFWYYYFGIENPRTLKLCIKVSLAEIFLICKLVHTTFDNR